MRLDDGGPNVRRELRQMGKVRDLRVNKDLRMCSYRSDGIDVDSTYPDRFDLNNGGRYVRAHVGRGS